MRREKDPHEVFDRRLRTLEAIMLQPQDNGVPLDQFVEELGVVKAGVVDMKAQIMSSNITASKTVDQLRARQLEHEHRLDELETAFRMHEGKTMANEDAEASDFGDAGDLASVVNKVEQHLQELQASFLERWDVWKESEAHFHTELSRIVAQLHDRALPDSTEVDTNRQDGESEVEGAVKVWDPLLEDWHETRDAQQFRGPVDSCEARKEDVDDSTDEELELTQLGLRKLADGDGRALQESVWEVVIMCRLPHSGRLGDTTIVVAWLFNFFVQLMFCVCSTIAFSDSDLPDLWDAVLWRGTVGHDYARTSNVLFASPVSRVCADDWSLADSANQLEVLQKIDSFTGTLFDGSSVEVGRVLCIIACLMWLMCIVHELQETGDLVLCCWRMWKHGCCATSNLQHAESGTLRFPDLCFFRFGLVTFSSVLRTIIAALLLIIGTIWLLNTTGIEDLILNAAALSFVLDFDEVMFSTFVPFPIRVLIRCTEPLPRPRGKSFGGLTTPPILYVVGLLFAVFFINRNLVDTVSLMKDLEDVLCGGTQDVVVTQVLSTGWFSSVGTDSYEEASTKTSVFAWEVVQEVAFSANLSYVNLSYAAGSEDTFRMSLSLDTATLGGLFSEGSCLDRLDSDDSFVAPYIHSLTNTDVGATCTDIDTSDCHKIDLIAFRMYCSSHCGCGLPRSFLFLSGDAFGCDRTACVQSENYMKDLSKIECVDPTVDELSANEDWTSLWDGALVAAESGIETVVSPSELLSRGCAAVHEARGTVCVDSRHTNSLAPWCPVACGCRVPVEVLATMGKVPEHCPQSCSQYSSPYTYMLSSVNRCADSSAEDLNVSRFLEFHREVWWRWTENATEIAVTGALYTSLSELGCSGTSLTAMLCGVSPYMVRALCPVSCGCLDAPHSTLCPASCLVNATL